MGASARPLSSGQMHAQSSGRSSQRITAPLLACSTAAHCGIGTPRSLQFDTTWIDTPMAVASFESPPQASAARSIVFSMPSIIDTACSFVNTLLISEVHTTCMTLWLRIETEIATRPEGLRREVAWLAEKLKTSIARVNNWKKRGVPSPRIQKLPKR